MPISLNLVTEWRQANKLGGVQDHGKHESKVEKKHYLLLTTLYGSMIK